MPSSPHNLRFPDALWVAAQEAVKVADESVNAVLVRALHDYVNRASWRERALAAEAEVRRLTEQMDAAVSSSASPQSR